LGTYFYTFLDSIRTVEFAHAYLQTFDQSFKRLSKLVRITGTLENVNLIFSPSKIRRGSDFFSVGTIPEEFLRGIVLITF
jgi:hypothetical protein